MHRTFPVLAAILALAVAAPAFAGVGDPVPAPFTKHVFSVPGIINDGVVTVISCTNALSTPLDVGVEWFRKNGTSLGVSSLVSPIPAGGTVNFGSGFAAWMPLDSTMAGGEQIKSGSARILSTTTNGLLCNAYVVDATGNPPARLMQLFLSQPKKQKGQ